jgi:signal peptidase I
MNSSTPKKKAGTYHAENSTNTTKSSKSGLMSWVIFIIFLLCIIIFFRYIVQFTVVSGNSMNPTLEDRDILFTSSLYYEVDRYDVIIYRDISGYDVIKRVIGMPNEAVEIREGTVFIDGSPIEENYTEGSANEMAEVTVAEGSYFVIGDNRNPGASLDSRNSDVGVITESRIKGKAVFSVFPPGKIE